MKKFLIFFVIFLFVFTISSYAATPSEYNSQENLLNDFNYRSLYFYNSVFDPDGDYCNFVDLNLKPDTWYTFYSSDPVYRYFIGPVVDSNKIYGTQTINLISPNGIYVGNGSFGYEFGDYTFVSNGANSYYTFSPIKLTIGKQYTISLSSIDSTFNEPVILGKDNTWTNLYGELTNRTKSLTFTAESEYLYIYGHIDRNGSSVISGLTLTDFGMNFGSSSYFTQWYSKNLYINSYVQYITFKTPATLSDDYVLGVKTSFDDSSYIFSVEGLRSGSIDIYLLEGFYDFNFFAEGDLTNSYNQGYNSGFDEGYKQGEYDGLESNNFMGKTLLTAVSSPFVVISNALNFEILGINFYRIIQLILTLLIVAFVMTKLKGRE